MDDYEYRLWNAIQGLQLSYEKTELLRDIKFRFNRLLESIKLDEMPSRFIEDKRVYKILKDLHEELIKNLVSYINREGKFNELPEDFDDINNLLFYIKKFSKTEDLEILINLISSAKKYLSIEDRVYLNSYLSKEGNIYSIEKHVKYYAFGSFDDYKDFDAELPPINDIYDFNNFIKWLSIGAELKHYELMRIQMLIFFNGYGNIPKDYGKAEILLRELLRLGDYSQTTNRCNMSYYSKYLAKILVDRHEIALAIGEIYSTSLYAKYTFEEILPGYELICDIVKNGCFIYHSSWTNGEQDISFNREKFDRTLHVYNKLVTMLESKKDTEIKFLKDYLNYLKEKQEMIMPHRFAHDDYYDPNPSQEELIEKNKKINSQYHAIIKKIEEIYESNWKIHKNFKYEIASNEVIIRKYLGDLKKESIPENIDGIPVTTLDKYLFRKSKIEHIDLPETIITIGEYCFSESNLISIRIPKYLKTLEKGVFECCGKLEEVIFGPNIEIINDSCFHDCVSLNSIKFPQSLLILESCSFERCTSLETISFENKSNLRIIKDSAFSSCESLKEICLPGSLYIIGSDSFAHCAKLHTVHLETNTKNNSNRKCKKCGNFLNDNYWCDKCNSLTNDDLDKDDAYDIDINSNLSHLYILNRAFYNCQKLKSFSYSDDLIKIFDAVFEDTALEEFLIRPTIKYIYGNPFKGCNKLIITCEEGILEHRYSPEFSLNNIVIYKEIIKNSNSISIDKSPFLDGNNNEIKEFYCYEGVIVAPPLTKKIATILYKILYDFKVRAVLFYENCQLEEIEQDAFSSCVSIRMVRLPFNAPIKKIPKKAFSDSNNLTTVILPKNIVEIESDAFKFCEKLSNIQIPESTKKIGKDAFIFCKTLEQIYIPSQIECIGESAFAFCENIEKVYISSNSQLKSISRRCFSNCKLLCEVEMPNSIEVIEELAFSSCAELTKLNFPTNLKKIGRYAFHCCSKLHIEFNDNLEIIEEGAFHDCGANSLSFNTSLRIIGNEAFTFCKNLKEVILPKSLQRLGDSVFWCSDSIERFEVHSENEHYSSYDGVLYDKDCTELIKFPPMKPLKSFIMPNTIIRLHKNSINPCSILKKIVLSKNLKVIDSKSINTENIVTLIIPASVDYIQNGGIYNAHNTDLRCEGGGPKSGWAETWCTDMKSIKWGTKE